MNEDLKTLSNEQLNEASNIVRGLGLSEDSAVNAVGLEKGDEFTLVTMRKVRNKVDADFNPVVFCTNTGASISPRNFAKIDWGEMDNVPPVGRTAIECAAFVVWCKDKGITFKVSKRTEEDREREYEDENGNKHKYNRVNYKLVIVDSEE